MNDKQVQNSASDPYEPDQISRIIMLIYGKLENGNPFWCYCAVKPSRYEQFKADEAAGKIDLYHFDPYGEVVVSGEGETPPQEVTEKVAEMYNADASTFFQPIDPQQEIAEKIEQLKAQDKQDEQKH